MRFNSPWRAAHAAHFTEANKGCTDVDTLRCPLLSSEIGLKKKSGGRWKGKVHVENLPSWTAPTPVPNLAP
jgi:hypothetical protein